MMTRAFPPGRWRAHWIWADPATDPEAARRRHVVALRQPLVLDAVPDEVPVRLSAVSRYALLVNGVEVARGPVRANPRRQPYDDLDLAPHLRVGTNVIGLIGCRYEGSTPWWLPGPDISNDLVRGAAVLEARVGDAWLVTDGQWTGTVLRGWSATQGTGISGRGRELVDARSLPSGWCDPSSEDPGWPAALVRRAMTSGEPGRSEPPSYPGGPLGSRPISWPTPTDMALAPMGGDAYGAGRIVVGTVVVDADGPAGAEVVIAAAEMVDESGRPEPGEHDSSVAFTLDGTRRVVESFDAYGLQGVRVDAPVGVTIHSITVRERSYPVTGDASFACSDELLETIWSVGRRTVTICSGDAYLDCPTREQRAWVGDAVVHQMVDLTTNTDWGLARWYPHVAASPRADGMLPMAVAGEIEHLDFTVIPDWALHWVHAVWNLYRYVGDRDEVAQLLDVAEGVVRWFVPFCDDDGVPTDVFGWVIIDWSSIYTEGVSASLCGLWGRALLEVAEMASWLGDEGRAGWARRAHAQLVAGFERLWDPERQRYVDVEVGGQRQPMSSQHAQAAAIVGGLAPADRFGRLVEVMTDEHHLIYAAFAYPDGPAPPSAAGRPGGDYLRQGHPAPWWDVDADVVRAQPFFRYVVHDALVAAGRADLIVGQLRDWAVMLERCPTSWGEVWYGGTISHGWSSTPTRDLMTRVLGVLPAEPGFAAARIEPALGDLPWARGAVPSPAGLIHVAASPTGVEVDSPIPFDLGGIRYPAGAHSITV